MSANIYKLNKSLGKFRALRTDNIGNVGFYAKICDNGMDGFNNGSFEANFYSNGELTDIEINGWTFSFYVRGSYHLPGTYRLVSFCIEAIGPEGTETSIYNTPYFTFFRESDVLCSFLDLIHMYSHFNNAQVAQRFYQLLRSVESGYSERAVDRDITPEVGMTQARFFKDFYEKEIESCNDKFFLKLIREAVNKVVDAFQDRIESYKIN